MGTFFPGPLTWLTSQWSGAGAAVSGGVTPLQAAAIGAGGVVVGAAATVLTGCFHPRATILGPVIWAGPRDRKAVALTFDDGPHEKFSPAVSEILSRRGAKGTFFCVGRFVANNPSLARELVAAGHQLGNHTWRHGMSKDLVFPSLLIEDLRRCQEAIGEAVGRVPTFYRPTVGVRTPAVHAAARLLGLRVVTWSHAARDGIRRFTAGRARRLAARVISGDVLALHDGTLTDRGDFRQGTIEHLPALVEALRDRGFSMVTLSDLLEPHTTLAAAMH